MDALNQGIAGYIFNAETLTGLNTRVKPDLITLAYGTNDWQTIRDFSLIEHSIPAYFKKLRELFPETPVIAITPIWRADLGLPVTSGAPLEAVGTVIRREAAKYPGITVVEGFELVPHDRAFFADGFLHPNAEGFAFFTENLAAHCGK
jgi:lysophospholipase L1-like esterase